MKGLRRPLIALWLGFAAPACGSDVRLGDWPSVLDADLPDLDRTDAAGSDGGSEQDDPPTSGPYLLVFDRGTVDPSDCAVTAALPANVDDPNYALLIGGQIVLSRSGPDDARLEGVPLELSFGESTFDLHRDANDSMQWLGSSGGTRALPGGLERTTVTVGLTVDPELPGQLRGEARVRFAETLGSGGCAFDYPVGLFR